MNKRTQHQIIAHENGWAVAVGDVLQAIYPSRHLALTAVKSLRSDAILNEEPAHPTVTTACLALTDAAASNRFRTSFQVMVAVPYQVDIPLKRRGGEISFPSSIDGQDLTSGKI